MTKLDKVQVDRADIVIVGNGIAGLTAAVEARRLAPEKRIVIVTEQSHPTINTPALKQFAIGKLTREQLLAYPAGTERAQFIHVMNARVEEIHAQEKYITLKGGRGFGYDSLLIATGSAPMGLPPNLPGRDFDGVLTLHRLNDYLDLRRRLSEVDEAVVIGGGAHAIETVMGLLYWGIRVHWLIRGDTFMSKMLDRPASDMVLESIRKAGVQVYTGTEALGIVGRVGAVAGVVTNHQQLIPCQLVLACIGTSPITSLARHCDVPLKHKQGIQVDDQLRTNVPYIYAAGDVAAIRDPQTGSYAPRAQWYSAVLEARMAASSMLGAPGEESFGVPWHATRLGDLSMLSVGNVLQWRDSTTTLTDSSRGSYRRMCFVDDRLVGYLSLGPAQPDSLAIKRIIDEGLSIRDIKKALLKGTFDARKFFSRQRTYAAQRLITTGRLPDPFEARTASAKQPVILSSEKIVPWITEKTGLVVPQAEREQQTSPLQQPAARMPQPPARREERLAHAMPSTGPLTGTFLNSSTTDDDVQLFAAPFVQSPLDLDQLQKQWQEQLEEAKRETDKLLKKPRVIEATLAPVSTARAQRGATSSLWSYSDRLPVVRPKKTDELPPETPTPAEPEDAAAPGRQFKAPPGAKPKAEKRQPRVYPTRSLWAYTDKVPVVKKGR